jgi:signal transduction histidine kinase
MMTTVHHDGSGGRVETRESSTQASRVPAGGQLLDEVRRRLLNAIFVVVALVGIPVVAASVNRMRDIGLRPVMIVQIAAVLAVLALATYRKRLPYRVLAGALFILIPVNGIVALLSFGLIGQGTLMMLVWATVISIFAGLRWGAAAAFTGVVAMAATGLGVTLGWVTFDVDFNAYSVAGSSWILAVMGCAFWAFLTAGCVGVSHNALADALRSSERRAHHLDQAYTRLRDLSAQLVATEERERRRLAEVLHDGVGQKLYAAKLRIGAMSLDGNSSAIAYDEVLQLIDESIDHTRTLSQELFPQILSAAGLVAAVKWLIEEYRRLHGVTILFHDRSPGVEPRDDIGLALFRSVRELLHNAAKHAQAKTVEVVLDADDEVVRVTVADDGVGFDPVQTDAQLREQRSLGLFSIRERLEHVGGRLEIRSRPDGGTEATAIAPHVTAPREES